MANRDQRSGGRPPDFLGIIFCQGNPSKIWISFTKEATLFYTPNFNTVNLSVRHNNQKWTSFSSLILSLKSVLVSPKIFWTFLCTYLYHVTRLLHTNLGRCEVYQQLVMVTVWRRQPLEEAATAPRSDLGCASFVLSHDVRHNMSRSMFWRASFITSLVTSHCYLGGPA